MRLAMAIGIFTTVIAYTICALWIDWYESAEKASPLEKHYYHKDILVAIDVECVASNCMVVTDSGVVHTDILVTAGDWIQERCYLTTHYEDVCMAWDKYTPKLPDREAVRKGIEYVETIEEARNQL